MTCEVLPPALSTRRTRAASRIASAASVLRHGGRDAEIVLLDGTTCTNATFAERVAFALRHDGDAMPEVQEEIDRVLTLAGYAPTYWERRIDRFTAASADDEPRWRATAQYGAIALVFCLSLIGILGIASDTDRRTDATLAQATEARFVEWSE
ncbi:hypothetical protein [Falsirhodobacter sp. 20TX0035]|uniref:hypothetical protein n=1 Tax=Falsirhodobacter sp. 20TX0035 TaxID=3022019 RepID=UPI00232D723E|nr:hypothetical protein [Falsirhodobacter sp. 20TX0035]MDB6454739.1 hypothetical protein [Falsirhodobacter sp. 20TX0035]